MLRNKAVCIKEEASQLFEQFDKIHTVLEENPSLKQFLEAAQRSIEIMDEYSPSSTDKIFELQSQFETLEDELNKLVTKFISDVNEDIQRELTKISEASKETVKHEAIVKNESGAKVDVEKIKELNEAIDKLEGSIGMCVQLLPKTDSSKTLKEVSSELNDLPDLLDELEATIRNELKTLRKEKKKFDKLKKEHSKLIHVNTQKVDLLNKNTSQLHDIKDQMQRQNAELQKEIQKSKDLEKKLKHSDEIIASHLDQVEKMKDHAKSLGKRLGHLHSAITDLKSSVDTSLDLTTTTHQNYQVSRAKIAKKLDSIREKTHNFSKEIKEFKERIHEKKSKYRDNYLKLQVLKAERKALEDFQHQHKVLSKAVNKAHEEFKEQQKKYKKNFSFDHKYKYTTVYGTKEDLSKAVSDFIVIFVDKNMENISEKTKNLIKKGGKVLSNAVNEMGKLSYGKIKVIKDTELN